MTWIKQNKILLIIFVVVTATWLIVAFPEKKPVGVSEISILNQLTKGQEDYLKTHGKYKQYFETSTLISGKKVKIHEYVTPDKQVGYQVLIKWSDGKNEYEKSIGYGPEAIYRTYQYITPILATTTP
jgi:hypothetical protein